MKIDFSLIMGPLFYVDGLASADEVLSPNGVFVEKCNGCEIVRLPPNHGDTCREGCSVSAAGEHRGCPSDGSDSRVNCSVAGSVCEAGHVDPESGVCENGHVCDAGSTAVIIDNKCGGAPE